MPSSITTTPVYPAVLQTPNDGDAANQASILGNFLQGVANGLHFFKDNVDVLSAFVSGLNANAMMTRAVRDIRTSGTGVSNESVPDHGGGLPTGTFADVAGSPLVMATGVVGDELHVEAVAPFNGNAITAGETCSARITVQSTSQSAVVIAQGFGIADKAGTGAFVLAMKGKHTMAYAEAYTVKLQIRASASGLGLSIGWFLRAQLIDV